MNKEKKTKIENSKFAFQKLDTYFEKRQDLFFYLSMGLLLVFNVLLFDMRISTGGDDSGYLVSAKKFIDGVAFPTYHGTLYSIVIGWFIKLVGFNLVLFKFLSVLFLMGHQAFFYYALKKHISPFILSVVLLILSVCSGLIYFGSQTYSEAFFLFLQGVFFFVFFKYLYNRPNSLQDIKQSWYKYLMLGFVLFMLATARNVAIVSFLSVILFLLLDKRFFQAGYTFLSFLIFSVPFSLYRSISWGIEKSDMSGQIDIMMRKHPYNKALGTEDLSGFVTRVVENLKNYLSKIFLKEIALKDLANNDTSLFIALLIVGILLVGLILSFNSKNRVIRFLFIYLGMFLGAIFISLHQMWAQSRMIIVFIPLLLIALAWTFGELSKFKKLSFIKYIPIALLVIIFFKSFAVSAKKASAHQKVLTKNIGGNKYYGYTPDWVNFLKMSNWASKKISEEYKVGSRKPAMSFIYGGGREFYPMYNLPIQFADSVMATVDASDKQVFFIKETDLRKKTAGLVYSLKVDMNAALSLDNVLYGVYLVDKEKASGYEQAFKDSKLAFINSADLFRKEYLSKAKKTTAIVPDDLLRRLKENNVRYLMVASLRVNPKMKTDRTINTVARYLMSMELKYPGIAKQVHQIGGNENEPAKLYEIALERYVE